MIMFLEKLRKLMIARYIEPLFPKALWSCECVFDLYMCIYKASVWVGLSCQRKSKMATGSGRTQWRWEELQHLWLWEAPWVGQWTLCVFECVWISLSLFLPYTSLSCRAIHRLPGCNKKFEIFVIAFWW